MNLNAPVYEDMEDPMTGDIIPDQLLLDGAVGEDPRLTP